MTIMGCCVFVDRSPAQSGDYERLVAPPLASDIEANCQEASNIKYLPL